MVITYRNFLRLGYHFMVTFTQENCRKIFRLLFRYLLPISVKHQFSIKISSFDRAKTVQPRKTEYTLKSIFAQKIIQFIRQKGNLGK